MSLIDTTSLLSGEAGQPIQTAAIDDTKLVSGRHLMAARKAWDEIVDHYLIEWGRDPGALEDVDFVPPSPSVIRLACQQAFEWRDDEYAPPNRVVPDGDGGIAFERFDEVFFESLRIYSDCSIELLVFKNGELQDRISIRL